MGRVIPIIAALNSERPPCFDSERQWREWNYYHQVAGSLARGEHFCTDCSPEYQATMVQEGRCLYPTLVQFRNGEGLRPNQMEAIHDA